MQSSRHFTIQPLLLILTFTLCFALSNDLIATERKIGCSISKDGRAVIIREKSMKYTLQIYSPYADPNINPLCNYHVIHDRKFISVYYETPFWGTSSLVKCDMIRIYEIFTGPQKRKKIRTVMSEAIRSRSKGEKRIIPQGKGTFLRERNNDIIFIIRNTIEKEDPTLIYVYDRKKHLFLLQ